jgi:hypothetical protein
MHVRGAGGYPVVPHGIVLHATTETLKTVPSQVAVVWPTPAQSA